MTNLKYLRQFASIFVLTLAADAACSSDQGLFGDSDEKEFFIPFQPNIKSHKSLPDLPKSDLFSNKEGIFSTGPASISIRNKNKPSNPDSATPEGKDEDAIFGGVGAPNAGDKSRVFSASSKSNPLVKGKEPSNLKSSKISSSRSETDLLELIKNDTAFSIAQLRESLRKSEELRRSQEKENQPGELKISQEFEETFNTNTSQKDRVEKKKSSPILTIRKTRNRQSSGSLAPKNKTQRDILLSSSTSSSTTGAISLTTTTTIVSMSGDLGAEGIDSHSRSFLTSASARLPRVGLEDKEESQVNDGLNPIAGLQNFLFNIEQGIVDKFKATSSPLKNVEASLADEGDYLFRLEAGRLYELAGRVKGSFSEASLPNLEKEVEKKVADNLSLLKPTRGNLSKEEDYLFRLEQERIKPSNSSSSLEKFLYAKEEGTVREVNKLKRQELSLPNHVQYSPLEHFLFAIESEKIRIKETATISQNFLFAIEENISRQPTLKNLSNSQG